MSVSHVRPTYRQQRDGDRSQRRPLLAEISNRLKSCRDVGGITRRRVMAACEKCNLCEHPGTLSTAVEIARIPCNVRKFRDKFFTIWRCTGCGSLHCKEDADLPAY